MSDVLTRIKNKYTEFVETYGIEPDSLVMGNQDYNSLNMVHNQLKKDGKTCLIKRSNKGQTVFDMQIVVIPHFITLHCGRKMEAMRSRPISKR